jgi:hypothetical protein
MVVVEAFDQHFQIKWFDGVTIVRIKHNTSQISLLKNETSFLFNRYYDWDCEASCFISLIISNNFK